MPSNARRKRLEQESESKARADLRLSSQRGRGASRMRQLGYVLVQVWLDQEELRAIKARHPRARLAALLRKLACENVGLPFLPR